MKTNDVTLLDLDLESLADVVGGADGDVEPIWPHVCGDMSDRGEWASPGCGDLGQFL